LPKWHIKLVLPLVLKRSKSHARGVNRHHDGNLSITQDWNLRRSVGLTIFSSYNLQSGHYEYVFTIMANNGGPMLDVNQLENLSTWRVPLRLVIQVLFDFGETN
jgi:hypothetical protein